MRSRGPDAGDAWISDDGRVGFGHRRLAIIDLSPGGAQPMHRGALRHHLQRRDLQLSRAARGARSGAGGAFTSQSDTEVLLQLYDEERSGDARRAARHVRLRALGRRAAADAAGARSVRHQAAVLRRRRRDDSRRVAGAARSSPAGRVSTQFDPAGAAGFFLRGTVPEPFTMYRAIRALPAGSYCYVDANGAGEPVPYFSIAATLRDAVERDEHFTDDQRREDRPRRVARIGALPHGRRRSGRRVSVGGHRFHRGRRARARERRDAICRR